MYWLRYQFHIQKSPKCFTIEQPMDTPVVFAYEILDAGHSVQFDLHFGTGSGSEPLITTRDFY